MRLSSFLLTLALFGAHSAVAGVVITLAPQTQTVAAGASTQVQVRISGLGSDAPPSLGAFDLNLAFNPAVLSFTGITFGDPTLGDQLNLSGFGPLDGSSASSGMIQFFEISLDSAATLDTQQPSAFALATLQFNALHSGSSLLTPTLNSISDSQGKTLAVTFQSGTINVAAVPEPSTIGLSLSAFVTFAFRSRRRRLSRV